MEREQGRQEAPKERARPKKVLLVTSIVVFLVLVFQLVWFGIVVPKLTLRTVEISGLYGYTEAEILGAAGIYEGMMYQQIDEESMRTSILQLAGIRSVDVEKVFPNQLFIRLVPREVLGLVFMDGQTWCIDETGTVFPQLTSGQLDAPVLSGLPFEQRDGTVVVPLGFRQFLNDLNTLKLKEPELYGLFSQFQFEKLEPAGFQVWVYPEHVVQRVLISDRFPLDYARYLLRILAMLETQPGIGNPGSIDFRTGDVIFTVGGGL